MAESQSFWSCSKGKCLCVTTLKTDQYYYFIAKQKVSRKESPGTAGAQPWIK